MAKYKIMVGRLAVSGTERVEVGTWLVEIACVTQSDPEIKPLIEDVLHVPVARTPTPVARNLLVHTARQQQADILFMVDDDMGVPEGFFKTAFLHLISNPPCVIGTPYCCGGTNQEVQVFEWASPGNHAQQSFSLSHIPREDAARRTGIEQVANIGTGVWAANMKVFALFEKQYGTNVFFDYSYNDDHTAVIETEDTYFGRHAYFADVPIYCSWGHWADHHKTTRIGKPYVVERKDIQATYLAQARAELRKEAGAA